MYVKSFYPFFSVDNRTLLDQTVAELKHQVSLLKQRENKVSTENKELQHTILDLETRLSDIQDRNDNFSSYSVVSKLKFCFFFFSFLFFLHRGLSFVLVVTSQADLICVCHL